ncbi:putative FUN34-transmembrane protein [Atractiella rhizophila]|nr:putative FUN34-transmembrane protein [Atractiella rhizophila]
MSESGVSNGEKVAFHGAPVNRAVTPGGHPVDTSQPAFPVYHRKFANPAPLGLMGFAGTTFFLSMINVQARHVTIPNVVVGLALGYGGLAQLLAGMWEFAAGNTFGATAFSSYGAFWLSFAAIYIPDSGILAAFEGEEGQLVSSVGIYLATWFIFTTLMLICTLRSSWGLIALFFFLDITFLLLMAGEFTENVKVHKAGGAFGIITAFIAWYVGLAGILTPDNSFFVLPVGEIRRG